MAKNNIIARKGTSLNLSTNKSIKTANLYEEGDELNKMKEAVEDLKTAIGNVGAEVQNPSGLEGNLQGVQGRNAPWWSKIDLGNSGEVLGKVGTGLGAATALYGLYNQTANNIDHTKLDAEKAKQAMVPNSVSIGNYDALADWKDSMPSLNTNLTNSDLDNMTGLQKFGSIFSGALTGGAAGWKMSKNPYVTAATTIAGAATGLAGLFKRDSNISDMVSDSNDASRRLQKRVDAMYNHELRDIQEENNNIAMANLSAKGGKINIAPSKRGTFKAQAKRMGMSVQEAARHILAHKDRYSPAMRKKANFARNFAHAYGGELFADGGMFEHPAEYNHGGYFSLDPELIKINQGGTHEQNPLNGVPMGFDENGIPNLVEEGETIFDDYVFSNRLAPTEQQLAEGGLATKYKDHTFADISAKIAKQYEETPNDEISKESMKESMQRLRTIQEQVKEDKEAEEQINAMNDFAMMPPEEQQAAMTQMQQQQQPEMLGAPEEIPQEAMPQDIMQDVSTGMETYDNAPVDMMAFGGNLFSGGGDSKKNAEKIADKYADRGTPEWTRIYNEALAKEQKQASDSVSVHRDIYNALKEKGYSDAQIGFVVSNVGGKMTFRYNNLKRLDPQIADYYLYGDNQVKRTGKYNPGGQSNPNPQQQQAETSESKSDDTKERDTKGEAGSARRYNTTAFKEGLTPEQKRQAWYETSGRALKEIIDKQADAWSKYDKNDPNVATARKEFVEALNAIPRAYGLAYEAGYDPKTNTAAKSAAIQELQRVFNEFKGNRYFGDLAKYLNIPGDTGDNSVSGWADDGLWGAENATRNWGLTEYFGENEWQKLFPEYAESLRRAGITYSPTVSYGKNGQKAYTFAVDDGGLNKPLEGKNGDLREVDELNPSVVEAKAKTPEEKAGERAGNYYRAMQEAMEDKNKLPTWMRYAPILGAGISTIWDLAQKPDYSVAEAVANASRNIPRARFNPIGNYLTYRPVDRNYYLNQVRNQGLANERAVLNASGANQGAATAALLANQYNTQNAIGNSLMQQELANRQNEQQVAQFNRGTDQYNSKGLFNESIYNQRSGMQRAQMGITAAQLRQAERQRRNAAISADLTNLFQGIGDIGWENFNANMVNGQKGNPYIIDMSPINGGFTEYLPMLEQMKKEREAKQNESTEKTTTPTVGKYGGMLTKRNKKSRRR